jgi:ribosomal protein L13
VSEVVGVYELFNLRVHRLFTAKLYGNGDTTMMELLLARMNTNQETMKTDQDVLRKTVKGMMAKMSAKMDAQHKKIMAILDAHHERHWPLLK